MSNTKNEKENKKIIEKMADANKKIEKGVVGSYKKIETGVVSGYKKIEDKFVDKFLKKDGETITSVADKFDIDSELCAKTNDLEADKALKAGQNMFLPGAKLDVASLAEINGDLFRKPIRRSYYLSSYFGWRANPFTGARSYHSGIDMACPQGTPIYAALAGTVTEAGYNNIYGNYVVITHHSGYKTLYGHMSAILAVKGQSVNTKTQIGKVGSTGMSTGPHLHFTVFKNGSRVNPLNYLP